MMNYFILVLMIISLFFMLLLFIKLDTLNKILYQIQLNLNNLSIQNQGSNLEKRLEDIQNTKFSIDMSLNNRSKNHGRKS